MTTSLRIGSLNVKRLSARKTTRTASLGAFVDSLGADVMALQEVESGPAAGVARGAGFGHVTFVGHSTARDRGVALLHRSGAVARSGERLSVRPYDDKGFARAVVCVGSLEVEVIGVHLDWLSHRARATQILALRNAVGAATMPRIVLGDLNAMTFGAMLRAKPNDDTVARLALALGVRPPESARETFPSFAPRWALDWILVSPTVHFSDVRVMPTSHSDHAAIVADLVFAA